MKFILKSFGLLSVAGLFALSTGCNNSADSNSGSPDSSKTGSGTVDSASSKPDSTKKDSIAINKISNTNPDQATIDYMVPGNTKEIAWLLAGEKDASNSEIKAHSKMMLADHKKLGQEVTSLIASKNLTAPPVDTINVVNIKDLKGKEWDKAWVDKMVKDHQELLDKLKQSEKEVLDSSLKKIVINTQPVVQHHLDMVKAMQDKMR